MVVKREGFDPLRTMRSRLSKYINLVVISSSLVLYGCSKHHPTPEEERERAAHVDGGGLFIFHHATYMPYHGGGSVIFPHTQTRIVTSSSTGVKSVASPSISSRGGFGGTAHGIMAGG